MRLWWFAQIEAGVERADIEREPAVGSEKVIEWLTDEVKYRSPNTSIIHQKQIIERIVR